MFVFLVISSMAAGSQAAIVDRVVAVVNGEPITLAELEKRAAPLLKKHITSDMPVKEKVRLKREIFAKVLPQMIDDKLVDEEIKRLGITVDDSEVNGMIDRICRENGITLDEFVAKLKEQGVTLDQYKEQVRKQIERARLINAQVKQKIVITDEQVKTFLRYKYPQSSRYGGPYYKIEQILIVPDDVDPNGRKAALERAKKALKELKAGKDFYEVASRYSNAGRDGVELGVFSLDEMAPVLRNAIEGLKPGETSGIVETATGFQILRLAGVTNSKEEEFDPLLMEEARAKLYDIEINNRFQEWLNQLRSKSSIRILL